MKIIQTIIGRQEEKKILAKATKSPDPEFIVVYGRRRVGKTHLIREYFSDDICFEIIGKNKAPLKEQLQNFAYSLSDAIGIDIKTQTPDSWTDAFRQLEQFLTSSMPKKRKGKRVLFFDELPWLNTPRSRFISCLEHFWNHWCSKQNDIILVVCGSAAAWMIQNIVQAKGGLHNRLTRQIRLLPFTLTETAAFLRYRGVKITRMQVIELYMVLGGIPHYLKQVEPGLSASQIIDSVCFAPLGLLREEFHRLYISLFEKNEQHIKIVRCLAKKRQGLARNEILKLTGLHSGGSVSQRLEELEESGFILSYIPFGKKVNDAVFRLSDEYSLFFLDWISRLGKRSPHSGYWMSQLNTPRRRTWAGYAFENLCLKHVQKIKSALGIDQVLTTESPWHHQPSQTASTPGAQIDLLIDHRDATINICEIIFSESKFTINKSYATDLRRKRDVFQKITGTKKNLFLTMITTYGITSNPYSKELVANSIVLDDLF